MKTFSFLIFATLPLWPVAAAAQLNVLISGGFSSAYEQLLPEFERTSGIKVTTGSGASQGTGPQTIAAQLARGVPANVVILSREGLSALAVMPVSEIVHAPGVDFAGSLAPEIQFVQTFSAAIVAGSEEIEASKRLIEFLASARASEAIKNSGMEPVTGGGKPTP
jgi:molybdate transport system substrate-binding protein